MDVYDEIARGLARPIAVIWTLRVPKLCLDGHPS